MTYKKYGIKLNEIKETLIDFIDDYKEDEVYEIEIILAQRLVDIIRNMPDDIIEFEVLEGFKILITSGNSKYNLNCFDPDEYPHIKIEEHKNPIIINSNLLKHNIRFMFVH